MLEQARSLVLGRSIRGRVGRILLLVGLGPLAAIALYVILSQRGVLSRTAEDNLANHARLEAAAVERVLEDAADDIQVLASNPVIQSPTASSEAKATQLRQAQDFFEVFEDITLIDPEGDVVDSTTYSYYGTWADKAWFEEALAGQPAMSDAHVIPSPSRHVAVFTAPVMSDGEVTAVIAGQMNMDRIWEILDGVRIGETGFVAAIDESGNLISHPRKDLLLTKLGGEVDHGAKISVPSERGGDSLTGQAAPVNVLGWQVVALQDSAEAQGPANDTLKTVGAAAAIVAAITVVLSFILTGGIARPVRALAAGMSKIAAGQLGHRVPRAGLQEIDDLATSFNTMAADLEESTGQRTAANEELERRYEELADARRQAATDGLTGLLNHRALQEALTKEVERSRRHGHSVGVLMMDIDGFKPFNDTYGHQAGDGVLRQVAEVLRRTRRTGDIIGRYGGDEFMVVLPETEREGAVSMARQILEAFSQERVRTGRDDDLPLAVSVGLAVCPEDSEHKQELLVCADASLYEAKQVSGNSLQVSQATPGEFIAYRETPLGILDALVRGIDSKDRYTHRHSQQDAELAVELGGALGLSEEPLRALRIAGLLHDVGKIGVPNHILRKPAPLTHEERDVMQEHVGLGRRILAGVPNLREVAGAVYTHHERWDGTGYPQGLKGEEIPLLGRILSIADAYSAMILDRPYRKALSHEEAVAELRRHSGTQFDPSLVEPFIRAIEGRRKAAA